MLNKISRSLNLSIETEFAIAFCCGAILAGSILVLLSIIFGVSL